jgi:acetyltransferase-like isoleucine patch superfamily enzyme
MTKLFAYGSVVWELFLGLLLKLTLFLHGSKFKWGAYIRVGSGLIVRVKSKQSHVHFVDRAYIMSYCSIVCDGGQLIIGNNLVMNNFSSINVMGRIEIGSDCLFGEGVRLYDHNHQIGNKELPTNQQGFKIGTIKIGNNVWLGSNVVVLKDVIIGDNVVVGANCLIHKDIPANSVVTISQNLNISGR